MRLFSWVSALAGSATAAEFRFSWTDFEMSIKWIEGLPSCSWRCEVVLTLPEQVEQKSRPHRNKNRRPCVIPLTDFENIRRRRLSPIGSFSSFSQCKIFTLHYNFTMATQSCVFFFLQKLCHSDEESVTVGGELVPLLDAACTIKEITFMNFRVMSAWSRHVDFPVLLGWRDTGAIVSTFTGKSIFQACKWSCSRSRRVLWFSDYSYGI